MKKFLAVILGCILVSNCVLARDYTKIQRKELQHAQKYGSTKTRTQSFTPTIYTPIIKSRYRDPLKNVMGNFEIISDSDYNSKLAKDDDQYKVIEKELKKVTFTNYNAQARGGDYYKVYRIAERIIRANRLDYQNWRIGITREADEINAYSTSGNYINLFTSLIDSCIDNDDALAMIIGHEMAHILLGHQIRKKKTLEHMQGAAKWARCPQCSVGAILKYTAYSRKFIIDSKNMEYAADIEGAKLAAKAGFNMNKANDVMYLYESFDSGRDLYKDHPAPHKRIESFNQNVKYFPIDAWKELGKYNIYNTDVLKVTPSSDRKSIVISSGGARTNSGQYYHPETAEELDLRFGYTCYLNGEFEKSLEYFDNLFASGCQKASAYLYASYAAEELYNQTKEEKYKRKAINYINKAEEFDRNNKYIKEQAAALQ